MQLPRLILICVSLLAGAVSPGTVFSAVEEDDVRQDLKHRWFEIEVVIFERLDAFEFDTVETLTSTKPPSWRHGFVHYSVPDAKPSQADIVPLCLGFPILPEALEPHPILAALLEAQRIQDALSDSLLDSVDADEPLATEAIDETQSLTEQNDEAILPEVSQPPSLRDIYLDNVGAFEALLVANSFVLEQEVSDSKELVPHVRAINRQSHLRPIFHERWRQMTPPRDAPIPMRISIPESMPRLHGTLSLTVARYLHFETDLWYETGDLGQSPRILGSDGASQAIIPSPRFIHIESSRRMRSEEIHYIDHPKVGILVLVRPLTIPASLIAELESVRQAESLQQ